MCAHEPYTITTDSVCSYLCNAFNPIAVTANSKEKVKISRGK